MRFPFSFNLLGPFHVPSLGEAAPRSVQTAGSEANGMPRA